MGDVCAAAVLSRTAEEDAAVAVRDNHGLDRVLLALAGDELAPAPALSGRAPPAVVAADVPGDPVGYRLASRTGLLEEEAVAEFRVVAMHVEQSACPVCLRELVSVTGEASHR
ncbi:hypothetical protein AB0941_38275 [Streptomyces sp. NPDC013433]|uniref:hypothetical protein n=1 Tax=Streptomyces sp. NPDC013433 TaxID=3155604 RepID=UPI00345412BB